MEYVKIGDICTKVCSGGTPSSGNPSYYEGGTIPWLNTNEVNFCRIYSTEKKITQLGYENSAAKYIDENSVIVAMYGVTAGKSAIAKIRLTTNQACCNLSIDSKKADYEYVYYYLKLQSETLNKLANGGAQQNLNSKIIKDFKIPLPPLATQHRIASILSVYDFQIENNQKRIKLLEQMAENLYKEWFVRFRFPGYEKAEFEGGVPKRWEKVELDSVLSKITTGLNPRKNFVLGQGSNFYVTIKNMGDNTVFLDENCDKVDDDAITKINKRSDLQTGDILFSGIGTIGRVCLIDIPTNNWNVSESVFTLRANNLVSKEYLYMLLLSDDLQNYCQLHAQGVAQPGIRMAELKSYRFELPDKEIIDSFTEKVTPILHLISSLRKQNNLLTTQRDLLLPRLMSGKLSI